MPRKYKNPKKPIIVSMRIADDEMENIQRLMEQMDKSASDIMRDAFSLFTSHWEMSGSAPTFAVN
jgi:predicted transcriptional regulator